MKKKNKPNYGMGGFGDFLQTISPLLGLIPGAGAIAAPVANIAGGMISQANQTGQTPMIPRQQNTNPYGMAEGGYIDPPIKNKALNPANLDLNWETGKITTKKSNYVKDSLPSQNLIDKRRAKVQVKDKVSTASEIQNPYDFYDKYLRSENYLNMRTNAPWWDGTEDKVQSYDYKSNPINDAMDLYKGTPFTPQQFLEELDPHNKDINKRLNIIQKLSKEAVRTDGGSVVENIGNHPNKLKLDYKEAKDINTRMDDVVAHELSHGLYGSSYPESTDESALQVISRKSRLINKAIDDEVKKRNTSKYDVMYDVTNTPSRYMTHDMRPNEIKADLDGFRYQLYRSNIYDSTKSNKFTPEHFKKAMNTSDIKSSINFKRLQGHYDSDTIIWLLNNIAQNKDDNTYKQHAASGGYLNQAGPNTQEVIGNNPSQTDGVELPQAYVDHGETISNTSQGKYVFSDILKNPLTGNSFAEDDKKLAMSDKKASAKKYDKEAQNTLKINEKMRTQLAQVNDITRGLSDLNTHMKGMAKGGYMKPSYSPGGPLYQTGYSAPWQGFDILDFQKAAGLKTDGIYGKSTNQAFTGDLGRQYAMTQGYLYDDATKGYIPSAGYSSFKPDYGSSGIPNVSDVMATADAANFGYGKNIPRVQDIFQVGGGVTGDPGKYLNDLPPTTLPINNTSLTDDPSITLGDRGAGLNADGSPIINGPVTTQGNPGGWNMTGTNIGTALQGLGFLAQAATIAKRPDKQNLYLNNAPITPQSYDPSQALNRSQYSFNALKSNIGNSVGDASRISNLQQGYANKSMNDAQIVNQYNEMNKQAQTQYEQRLAQRQGENNQSRYAVDQMNDQNLAARNNAARGLFANVAGLGSEINNQKMNKQSVQWLLSSYPDLINLPGFKELMTAVEEPITKKKKGGRYG